MKIFMDCFGFRFDGQFLFKKVLKKMEKEKEKEKKKVEREV